MPLDVLVYGSVLCLGVLLTGISKSGFAGNLGVITVPLLSLVMPIEQAAALMLPVINLPVLMAVLPSACLGIVLAALAMGGLADWFLQGALGLVCIVFALWHRLNRTLGQYPGAGLIWGTIAGFTSTLIHAGGPPMSVYFAGKQLPKLQWLATSGCFFCVINVIKLVPYTALGLWSKSLMWQALLVLPLAWFGVWLGRQIQQRFDDTLFVWISRALVFLSGVGLMVKAWSGA